MVAFSKPLTPVVSLLEAHSTFIETHLDWLEEAQELAWDMRDNITDQDYIEIMKDLKSLHDCISSKPFVDGINNVATILEQLELNGRSSFLWDDFMTQGRKPTNKSLDRADKIKSIIRVFHNARLDKMEGTELLDIYMTKHFDEHGSMKGHIGEVLYDLYNNGGAEYLEQNMKSLIRNMDMDITEIEFAFSTMLSKHLIGDIGKKPFGRKGLPTREEQTKRFGDYKKLINNHNILHTGIEVWVWGFTKEIVLRDFRHKNTNNKLNKGQLNYVLKFVGFEGMILGQPN